MFQDITKASGIDYKGASYGVAWGDYNQDGFVDLWVGNHGFPAALYQNQGDGTFIDVTATVFEQLPRGDFHGAAWADFDNDGDLDLIQLVGANVGTSDLSNPEIANRLYVNEGGFFSDRAIELGLGYIGSRGRNPLWFDLKHDGLLDLLQTADQRADGQVPATIFQQQALDQQFVDLRSSREFDLTPTRFGIFSDLFGDKTLELILLNSVVGISVYDLTEIEDITDQVLATKSYAQDFVVEDFNGDLLPDFYLTRNSRGNSAFTISSSDSSLLNLNLDAKTEAKGISFETEGEIVIDLWLFGFTSGAISPEQIFIGASAVNPQDLKTPSAKAGGKITELQLTLNSENPQVEGLASSLKKEDEGLYIGYDSASATWEIYLSASNHDLLAATIKSENEIIETKAIGFNNNLQPQLDQILLNDGSKLVDRTDESGLNSVRTAGVSTVAGDFDNDMDLDLYIVTANPTSNEPNVLYENLGDGKFMAVEDLGDAEGSSLGIGDTVTTADYNNDGFLDLLITNGNFPNFLSRSGPYQLLENTRNNNYHWLEIELEGVVSNRDGIGAQVYVTAGGITQLRQQTGGIQQQVQSDSRLHFGLAENTMVEEIRVEWSSGIVQVVEDVAVDQILNLIEPEDFTALSETSDFV
ncbi:MAG: CRTAC1 family protein [Cyanobacteria bacterium P01_A01_bin.40]